MDKITADEITDKLLDLLRPHLKFSNDDQVFPMDVELEKLGLDSMSAVNLLVNLEETFGIQFPDSMLTYETFRTASTLEAAIQLLIDGQS